MKKIHTFIIIIIVAFAAGLTTIRTEYQFSAGSFAKFIPHIEIVQEEIRPTSLTFVGDVLLARRVESYLDAYGSGYTYQDLPEISSTTVLIGNFEASIPKEHVHTPDLTFSFSVDSIHIPALRNYGFAYMSLANNHSADKGLDGFTHTQKVLTNNDIMPVGSPLAISTTSIGYIELEGRRVALIGVYAVDAMPAVEEIESVLAYASQQSDIQIAYIHWGVEYQPRHSSVQKKLAYLMIDAGADAIIGHHPHVVQDIELYNDVPIFYSLGNVIFDQYFSNEVQEGLWVEMSFEDDAIVYALQGITSIGSRSVPRFMAASENEVFLTTLAKKSSERLAEQIRAAKIIQ